METVVAAYLVFNVIHLMVKGMIPSPCSSFSFPLLFFFLVYDESIILLDLTYWSFLVDL